MSTEAICIGGVLDGRRKPWVGRKFVAAKPIREPFIIIDNPPELRPLERDVYRREIIAIQDDGKVEKIPLWIIEGMSRNEAMLRVFKAYSGVPCLSST